MSIISFNVNLPLDSEGFLRRKCPFCIRQFKIEIQEEDRKSLIERELESYLLQEGFEDFVESSEITETEESELWCTYCGQSAPKNQWWTQEQIAYVHDFCYNIMAKIVNEQLIRPMKRQFSGKRNGLVTIKFDSEEMKYREPWIAPEFDDMTLYALPCCDLKIKIEDNYMKQIHCYQCGFIHTEIRI